MFRIIAVAALALAALAATAVVGASWLFDNSMRAELDRLVAAARPVGGVVTEAQVAALPLPIRRHLLANGVVGRPIPTVVHLTQKGRIRGSAEAAWMEFEAEQTYTTNPPGLIWRAWFPSRSMPVVMGRDAFVAGSGSIVMKMAGLVPVADERGPELTEAAMLRYLNEMWWFPQAYLLANVSFGAIDDNSVEISFTDGGRTVSGTGVFDDAGRWVTFRAPRYNTGTRSIENWQTPVSGTAVYGGITVPAGGAGVWSLAGGEFSYIELEVTGVTYE